MKTLSDLMRSHHPEFVKVLEEFKVEFGAIKREFVTCPIGTWGNDLTGNEINPVISNKIKSL